MHLGVKGIFLGEFLEGTKGGNVSEKCGQPRGPELSRVTCWLLCSETGGTRTLIADVGAKRGGKGELILRVSAVAVCSL